METSWLPFWMSLIRENWRIPHKILMQQHFISKFHMNEYYQEKEIHSEGEGGILVGLKNSYNLFSPTYCVKGRVYKQLWSEKTHRMNILPTYREDEITTCSELEQSGLSFWLEQLVPSQERKVPRAINKVLGSRSG